MTTRLVIVAPLAEAALADAADYSEARWGYGQRCLDAFERLTTHLADFPRMGSEIEPELHRVPFPAPFPYWILYRPTPTAIESPTWFRWPRARITGRPLPGGSPRRIRLCTTADDVKNLVRAQSNR